MRGPSSAPAWICARHSSISRSSPPQSRIPVTALASKRPVRWLLYSSSGHASHKPGMRKWPGHRAHVHPARDFVILLARLPQCDCRNAIAFENDSLAPLDRSGSVNDGHIFDRGNGVSPLRRNEHGSEQRREKRLVPRTAASRLSHAQTASHRCNRRVHAVPFSGVLRKQTAPA